MILFETKYLKIFNHTINYLLKDTSDKDVEDILEEFLPKYLRRERFQECLATFNNLVDWTEDDYYHRLDLLSKVILYEFFNKKDIDKLVKKLQSNKAYNKKIKKQLMNYTFDEEYILKNLYDASWYRENIFIDQNIIDILQYQEQGQLEVYLKKHKNIIPTYIDIFPNAIKDQFTNVFSLTNDINELLDFIQDEITNGSLTYLFWQNEKPVSETKIQEIFKSLFDAYYNKVDIEINRESVIGSGKIDFKFYQNQNEQIIFELKKAKSNDLKHGYEVQLVEYMKACNCKRGYYIILCFNDKEIEKARKLIEELTISSNYHYYINIITFDLRKDKKELNYHTNHIYYNNESMEIDEYFRHISKMEKINNVEEFKNYFKEIFNNYKKINNINIKQEYIERIHEICMNDIGNDFNILNFIFEDNFYNIYQEDALRKMIYLILRDVVNEHSFMKKIPDIIDLLNKFQPSKDTELITRKEIMEIFDFLKKERPLFYNVIKNEKLNIYLLDETCTEFNSSVIPMSNAKEYIILCTHMRDKKKKGFAIYVFFYLLGQILNWSITQKHLKVMDSFLEAMSPYTKNLKSTDLDASIVFADCVAMYLMHNSKYDKYNPFIIFEEEVYPKLQVYFDNLLDRR